MPQLQISKTQSGDSSCSIKTITAVSNASKVELVCCMEQLGSWVQNYLSLSTLRKGKLVNVKILSVIHRLTALLLIYPKLVPKHLNSLFHAASRPVYLSVFFWCALENSMFTQVLCLHYCRVIWPTTESRWNPFLPKKPVIQMPVAIIYEIKD